MVLPAGAFQNIVVYQRREKKKKMLKHNFKAESSDHYETPMQAYRHIERVLNRIAKVARKSKESFTIYDPYFCDGKVIKNFKTLGWSKVVNVNKDFYKDIQEHTLPKYDVLVTNPPYSFDHIEKILSFCQKNRQMQVFCVAPAKLFLPFTLFQRIF